MFTVFMISFAVGILVIAFGDHILYRMDPTAFPNPHGKTEEDDDDR